MNTPRDVSHVTFRDIRVTWSDIRYTAFWSASRTSLLRRREGWQRRTNRVAKPDRCTICLRAARDTCAPRAVRSSIVEHKILSQKALRFLSARGAHPSRDTSAARQLSSDFSYSFFGDLGSSLAFLAPAFPIPPKVPGMPATRSISASTAQDIHVPALSLQAKIE